LGGWLNVNKKLLHLDLSYNRLSKLECYNIGQGLLENHTLVGLHLRGNEGEVDTLGFIKEKPVIMD
jgi:hypothetical protein